MHAQMDESQFRQMAPQKVSSSALQLNAETTFPAYLCLCVNSDVERG